jgi:hypothetical protein
MPTGSDPVWRRIAEASSSERLMMRARPARSFTRLRTCQRQSLQSRALASGKNRLRKSWLRGLIGNRSRAVGRLTMGAKKGGFAALGVILGERACRS